MPIRLPLLVTLGLLSGLTPFAIDMYLPSLPAIARDLGSTMELAQISVTVYLGVFAVAQLLLGPLSDMLGRRATIGGGLVLFCLGSLGCTMAGQMETLLLGRAIQALGGAAIAVTVPAVVRDLFERDLYARVMSLVMLVMAMAPLLAPTIGGLDRWLCRLALGLRRPARHRADGRRALFPADPGDPARGASPPARVGPGTAQLSIADAPSSWPGLPADRGALIRRHDDLHRHFALCAISRSTGCRRAGSGSFSAPTWPCRSWSPHSTPDW